MAFFCLHFLFVCQLNCEGKKKQICSVFDPIKLGFTLLDEQF